MVKVVAFACAAAVVWAGCYDDHYRCTADAQCDLGQGGRCELSGRCTAHDPLCPLERRYTAHSGELSKTCYDHHVPPQNPCVAGQPPAQPVDCFAEVCAVLPACCETGWSNACVQLAQQQCETACTTRLAIDASRNNARTQLWLLTWNGSGFTAEPRTFVSPPFSWIAPAPGTLAPRLAAGGPGGLLFDDLAVERPGERVYQSITSVDVDRAGRDTVAMTYTASVGEPPEPTHVLELLDLATGASRETTVKASQNLAWGDRDGDGFPDGVAKLGGQYVFFDNADGADHRRVIVNQSMAGVSGGPTPGFPPVRRIDWADLDGDLRLDLAVFGNSVRLHLASPGLGDTPDHDLDCEPPSASRPCAADPEPDLERVAFTGAMLPALDAPSLIIASVPGRQLHRARIVDGLVEVEPLRFGNTCPACPPIAAVVVRDLDGDRALDAVAIDAELRVYTALAADGLVFRTSPPLAPGEDFNIVDVSVAGVPTSN